MTPPFHKQHSQLLRELREVVTYHQIELEQFERYIRTANIRAANYDFDLRLQRDMHDRFVTAIGAAIQSLEIANAHCASC